MRFLQPDSIVPDQSNPQSWNRYSYGLKNPSRYTDPSGHSYCDSKYALKEDCEEQIVPKKSPPPDREEGDLLNSMLSGLVDAQELALISRASTKLLKNGRVSLSASPLFREAYGLRGTVYNPSTVSSALSLRLGKGALTKGNIAFALGLSVVSNLYDYTYGENAGKPIGQEFAVSVAVDAAVAVAVTAGVALAVGAAAAELFIK
jgi:hypothetical protein